MPDDFNPTAVAIRHVMDEGARRERLTIVAYLREAGEEAMAGQIEQGWHIDPLARSDERLDADG
jgi:hypothetical protein